MPIIARRELTTVEITLGDYDPEEQCRMICDALSKPKKAETIHGKLAMHWPIVSEWLFTNPDLFDEVMTRFVAEIAVRGATVRDGIAFTSGDISNADHRQ